MKIKVKFQGIKLERGQAYATFKTDKALHHTNDDGTTIEEPYITKSVVTLLKSGGDVCRDALTSVMAYANHPLFFSVEGKALSLIEEMEIKENEIKPNQVKEGHSEPHKWWHHEIVICHEMPLSAFAEKAYFKAVDALSEAISEMSI